jgi:hypothetical protein
VRSGFSEATAFRAALAAAAVLGLASLVGYLARSAWAGVALLAVVAFALAGAAYERTRRPEPETVRRPTPPPDPRRPGARHRILVVANESLGGSALRRELMRRLEIWPEVHVLAPVLPSRSHYWASDWDDERAAAQARLRDVLAWAREHGFDADGEVGDDDPLATLDAALTRLGPNEVIVAMHPPERAGILEERLVDRILARASLPVTLVVEAGDGAEVVVPGPDAPLAR